MEERILVNLTRDRVFESENTIIGRSGEGNTSRLEITLPDVLHECAVYLDFEKPNGEKLTTPKLKIVDGVAIYDVVPYLLTDAGEVKVQAVLITPKGGTWKSSTKHYINQHSINALDEVPDKEDFITEARKVMAQLSQEIDAVAMALANDPAFIENVANNLHIERFVTTIKGERLYFFVGTTDEYNALLPEEKRDLFAIITDDKAKEEIENAITKLEKKVDELGEKVDNINESSGEINGVENLKLTSLAWIGDVAMLAEVSLDKYSLYLFCIGTRNENEKLTILLNTLDLSHASYNASATFHNRHYMIHYYPSTKVLTLDVYCYFFTADDQDKAVGYVKKTNSHTNLYWGKIASFDSTSKTNEGGV